MSVLTLEAKLERLDSATPWGFRMQGGKDFHSPLTIQRVTPGSLASKCGLQSGDIILKIGKSQADVLKHKEAQDTIISCGNKLDLLLQRGAVPDINRLHINSSPTPPAPLKAPSPIPLAPSPPPPPPPPPLPATSATTNAGVNYNATPRPFPSGSGGVILPPLQSDTSFPPPPPTATFFQPSVEKYSNVEEDRPVSTQQSRSFKLLQGLMDSGQEPPSALRPLSANTTPNGSRSVSPQPQTAPGKPNSVKAIGNWQYNSPIGLYSKENVHSTFQDQSKILSGQELRTADNTDVSKSSPVSTIGNNEKDSTAQESDEAGRQIYRPSETYRLIHQQDEENNNQQPLYSKTFKRLQQKLDESPQPQFSPASVVPPPPPAGTVPVTYIPPPPVAPLARASPSAAPARAHAAMPARAPARAPAPAPVRAALPRSAPPKPTGIGATKGKKGDAVYQTQDQLAGRIPVCAQCGTQIRGPFVLAMSKSWCPDHFICANPNCGVKLFDIGFVEEGGYLYCERDYEQYFAPHCSKCSNVIVGECVNALNTTFHPQCFVCVQCKKPMGNSSFHIEDGDYYCDADWKAQFQAVCFGCKYPIDPGDRWVEALDHSYHSDCFSCTSCHVSLEGQPFYAKGGKPYCKKHAR